MVSVGIFILMKNRFGEIGQPEFRPGVEDEVRLSRRQRDWRASAPAARPDNAAGRLKSLPSKPENAPACATQTMMGANSTSYSHYNRNFPRFQLWVALQVQNKSFTGTWRKKFRPRINTNGHE